MLIGLYYFLVPNEAVGDQKSIVETTMPALDKAFDEGAQLYADNCAQCHGKTLGGVVGNGPPFIRQKLDRISELSASQDDIVFNIS